jgi:hypothetical protein
LDSSHSTHALEHDTAQRQVGFLPQVEAAAQALCAYLSLGVCRDECLKGTLSFCLPVASREQVQSREVVFKVRRIGGIRCMGEIPQKKIVRLSLKTDMRCNAFIRSNS